MLYSILRPLLFKFDAETAHHLTLDGLQLAQKLRLISLIAPKVPCKVRTVMGLDFPNPVGLAAGLDKNGACIDALAALGFGFIEVGTVTPRPQPGNPKPRLFRIPQANAIINRMGFNNDGVDNLIENIKKSRFQGILGINIGKNFDTPIENAAEDYLIGLRKVYPYASYITVNISSPNTKNLRQLQQADELSALLEQLKTEQDKLATQHGKYVPIALKIAPDLDTNQVVEIAELLITHKIDAVIATNTTLSREGVKQFPLGAETGGLSGEPIRTKSTSIIKQLSLALQKKVPIIGVGGIMNGLDAEEKMKAGASLVQVYSGMIYRGPELVKEVVQTLCRS